MSSTSIQIPIVGEKPEAWFLELSGDLPEDIIQAFKNHPELTIDNYSIRRHDEGFYDVRHDRTLGYGKPMVFQKPNPKTGHTGSVCIVVRRDPTNGQWYIAVERTKYTGVDGKVHESIRAFRSSVSSPEGSPIPTGTKRIGLNRLSNIHLDNQRLADETATFVIRQKWTDPCSYKKGKKFELMAVDEFVTKDDGPGKATWSEFITPKYRK